MKFKYRYLKDKTNPSKELNKAPLLQVQLAYRDKAIDVVGLIDTGAADCLFDIDVADDLGIDLKDSQIEKDYLGISGKAITGYVHRIGFQVQGFSEWIEIDAGFLPCKLPVPLIGESGFFDNYEITFMRYKGRFEIKSRTFLHR